MRSRSHQRVLVTGGAGFIGSCLVRQLIAETDAEVLNVDKLTYAGNTSSLDSVADDERYHFAQIDIADGMALRAEIDWFQPTTIMHLAAESHVDRSIDGPADFITTNIVGTFTLLEAARAYWSTAPDNLRQQFRFLHVSTDEVYGSLGATGLFDEETPYRPNSPYSASKASSDHLVRSWHHTYGLPTLITNCSNNYGPYQYPEKLIPVVIRSATQGRPIPVYGRGKNIRDWLFVEDHTRALWDVVQRGRVGETYNIGGHNEKTNLEVVTAICSVLDELLPQSLHAPHEQLITFVEDRPGHDLRYAIDATKIEREIDWHPRETFETGLRRTVRWYLDNEAWCQRVLAGRYSGERLGLAR